MVASIVATPFVFYGLEFWDHAPAVACVLAGTVLALREPAGVASRAAAGALWILSLQLRPEMAAGVVAAAAVVALRRSPRVLIAAAFGAAVAAAPFVVYSLAHFGQITSPHVAINLALVGERWWQERLVDARSWFGTTNPVSIAGFAAIGAGWLCLASARVRAFSPRIALLGAVLISFEAAFGRENGQNFFRAFPLGILALMPTMSVGRRSRDLALLVILPLVGCWLTAPNDGGGQWGARYLLVIVPPMLILAIQRFSQLTRAHRGVLLLGLWFLAAGLVVSRTAYQELRGAKRYYSRLAATTAAQMGDARHLLTDAWWVPAAHAAVIDYRRTAVIDRAADAGRVLSAFSRDDVLAVTDRTETKFVDWTIDTCYRVGEEMRSADGRLRYARLSCR
jgi:hypothetical protein